MSEPRVPEALDLSPYEMVHRRPSFWKVEEEAALKRLCFLQAAVVQVEEGNQISEEPCLKS